YSGVGPSFDPEGAAVGRFDGVPGMLLGRGIGTSVIKAAIFDGVENSVQTLWNGYRCWMHPWDGAEIKAIGAEEPHLNDHVLPHS
ncbi:MAG: hypothetical protein AAAC47_23150, partial [Pararhizobium sp.]